MLEIEIPKELFEKIQNMRDEGFSRYLYEKLAALGRQLELTDEKSLERKKMELEKNIERMKRELKELTEFCERAEKDRERMHLWIEMLEKENRKLLEEMRSYGNLGEGRISPKEEIQA